MKTRSLLFLCGFLFFASSCWAWQGRVVGVIDGDSITVLHDGAAEEIRLYGVDCPEKRQDFGQKAKEFTSRELFGQTVEVTPVTTDRYRRTVALVSIGGQLFNQQIIAAGYAWVFQKYCTRPECAEWNKLEERARKSKTGLWSVSTPTPPWDFRHKK